MFENSKVLVTGGTGMIGRPLVEKLLQCEAKIRIVSLDDPAAMDPRVEFHRLNLMHFENCMKACEGMDYVFHLAGVKGSPAMTAQKPASFFVPTISFNTHMMEAARQQGVKRFLYTSSIGVYAPAEIFHEDNVWKTFPSENDKFAGWAKRMGELQAEAYRIEYGWKGVVIVRPANVYGPYDNFDPENAMVIPSLIRRAMDGENPLKVWGDGSPIRDFIHSRDVASGMMLAMEKPPEKSPEKPLNLGSGTGVSIRELVEIIVHYLKIKPQIVWDSSKPAGDAKRVMDISRAKAIGFQPAVSIEEGIREVMTWYDENREKVGRRYNVFRETKFV